jgi:hypothetical protein
VIDLSQHEAVVRFLDAVCARVRSREVHPEIRLELLGHLEDVAGYIGSAACR